MDLIRFITVYIVQGIMGVLYLYLGLKTLKRDTKRLNVILGAFYITIAIGVFINWIYAPLDNDPIVLYLNFATNFCFFWGIGFLTVFNIILLKSEKVFTSMKQALYLIIYGVVLGGGMFVLIHIPDAGVTIDPEKFTPIWSFPFFIYVVIIINIFATIPSIYFLMKVQKKFENEELKQKFRFFFIGVVEIIIFAHLLFTANVLNDPTIRLISAVIGFILVISAAYFLYIGVGRQISK